MSARRVAFVSGGAQDVGRAIAIAYAALNCDVSIADVDEDADR